MYVTRCRLLSWRGGHRAPRVSEGSMAPWLSFRTAIVTIKDNGELWNHCNILIGYSRITNVAKLHLLDNGRNSYSNNLSPVIVQLSSDVKIICQSINYQLIIVMYKWPSVCMMGCESFAIEEQTHCAAHIFNRKWRCNASQIFFCPFESWKKLFYSRMLTGPRHHQRVCSEDSSWFVQWVYRQDVRIWRREARELRGDWLASSPATNLKNSQGEA